MPNRQQNLTQARLLSEDLYGASLRVLIADDDPTTRLFLEETLASWGYDVVATRDGAEAWEQLQQDDPPRLAVLDWMMPEMDGIELCRAIQERNPDNLIYTILLTARDQSTDMITALEAGAHDFISKPCSARELRSHVTVGCRLIRYDQALKQKGREVEEYAARMEALAEERARQLVHADRMATLGVLSAGIAHEVNNPTSFISGNVHTMEMVWPRIREALENRSAALLEGPEADEYAAEQLRFILEEIPKALQGMKAGVQRIARIVSGLKAYARKDSGEHRPCGLRNVVLQALELCKNELKYHVQVETQFPDKDVVVKGNEQELEQVFVNLFTNAAAALRPQESGRLWVRIEGDEQTATCVVEDDGPGIAEKILGEVCKPFFTTKEPGKGTGLGLSISQRIIEGHNGILSVGNRPYGGARFVIELPVYE